MEKQYHNTVINKIYAHKWLCIAVCGHNTNLNLKRL